MRALEGAVLMGNASVVARWLHAEMFAKGGVAGGHILGCRSIQIAEGGREAHAGPWLALARPLRPPG